MRIWDMISMSLGNLFKRKVRTLLTVAGVIIGTCAIVVMISLGIGMRESMNAMMANMGDLTVIQLYQGSQGENGTVLDDKAVEQIQNLPNVIAATPIYTLEYNAVTIRSGKYAYRGEISGVNLEALQALGYQLEEGELPGESFDEATILFGHSALYQFYNTKKKSNNTVYMEPDASGNIPDPFVNPLEDKLEVVINDNQNQGEEGKATSKQKPLKLKCVGILTDDWSKNPSPAWAAFIDIDYAKKLTEKYNKLNKVKTNPNDKKGYQNLIIKVDAIENVSAVEQAVHDMGFPNTNSMESIREPMEKEMRQRQMILGGLGAISLLVAAFGIANTMIMSIYERTREIGVMKVLGCVVGNIRTMFLMEAGAIGFMGGVAGLAFSCGISFIINMLSAGGMEGSVGGGMGMVGTEAAQGAVNASIIPPWLALGALLFATLIGLISGFYPANRAVKISALTAIKQE